MTPESDVFVVKATDKKICQTSTNDFNVYFFSNHAKHIDTTTTGQKQSFDIFLKFNQHLDQIFSYFMTILDRWLPGLLCHTRATSSVRLRQHNSRQIDVSRVVLVRSLKVPRRSSSDSRTFSLERLRDGGDADLLRGVSRVQVSRFLRVGGHESYVVELPIGVWAEDHHLDQVYAVFDGWGGGGQDAG